MSGNYVKKQPLLVEEETKVETKEEVKVEETREVIPSNYIPIKLDSLGKLSAPAILHFRNYSMDEAIELSTSSEDRYIDTLIACLNNMVYEDFDCINLHESELEQIMMTLYLNFWSKTLEGFRYYCNPELTGEELDSPENIDDAIIEINKLKTVPINEKFKEPIKITINNQTVKFRLPRIKDVIDSRTYIEKKYFTDDRKLSDLYNKYKKDPELLTYDEKNTIEEFHLKKGKELLKLAQTCLILEVSGKKYETLEEKLSVVTNVSYDHWEAFNNYVEKELKFGIDSKVTFFSLKLKKDVTRRFQFQSMDFIPPLGSSRDTGAVISFGD